MDETVRLTYGELAKARGITLAAARRMTLRHKWPKQIGNDGLTRVSVPASALVYAEHDGTGAGTGDAPADIRHTGNGHGTAAGTGDGTGDLPAAVKSLGDAVVLLGTQLIRERERADHAEAELVEERNLRNEYARRAGRAERQVEELEDKLEDEMIEHRQSVSRLTEQLAARRSWWPWRR
jgi:hypothetical protein